MGPDRLMLMSDQPILELFVRSTVGVSALIIQSYSAVYLTLVVLPGLHIFEVVDPGIVVVLAWEYNCIHVSGMCISNRMTLTTG
jgi:hypothetical protein